MSLCCDEIWRAYPPHPFYTAAICTNAVTFFLCCVLRPLPCLWTAWAPMLCCLGELLPSEHTSGLHRGLLTHWWSSFTTGVSAVRVTLSSSLSPMLFRRRFLYMVNLEAPSEPPRKIGRQSKWDVGTVQWNPHKAAAQIFAASVS